MYQWPEVVEEGGFAAYGPRFLQLYRDVIVQRRGRDLKTSVNKL
jgi:hypothetical protein